MTKSYDGLPWLLRIVLQIFFGWIIGGVYRIVKFVESREVSTLVVGILALVTGVGNLVIEIVDLVTTIFGGGISFFAK